MTALILCPAHFQDFVLSSPQPPQPPSSITPPVWLLCPQSRPTNQNGILASKTSGINSILSEEMKLQIGETILSENPQGRIFQGRWGNFSAFNSRDQCDIKYLIKYQYCSSNSPYLLKSPRSHIVFRKKNFYQSFYIVLEQIPLEKFQYFLPLVP